MQTTNNPAVRLGKALDAQVGSQMEASVLIRLTVLGFQGLYRAEQRRDVMKAISRDSRLTNWAKAYWLLHRALLKKFANNPYVMCWTTIDSLYCLTDRVVVGDYGKFVFHSNKDYGIDIINKTANGRRHKNIHSFVCVTQQEYEFAQAVQFIQDCAKQQEAS